MGCCSRPLRRAFVLYLFYWSYYGTSVRVMLWPIFGITSYNLDVLWMCWILMKRRPDMFRKSHRCIFLLQFLEKCSQGSFSEHFTDFHIYSTCTWARIRSGSLPLCKPLLKLIISYSNTDNLTDLSSKAHTSVALSLSLHLHTHTHTHTLWHEPLVLILGAEWQSGLLDRPFGLDIEISLSRRSVPFLAQLLMLSKLLINIIYTVGLIAKDCIMNELALLTVMNWILIAKHWYC